MRELISGRLIALCAALVVAVAVAGCGGDDGDDGGSSSGASSNGPVTLTWWDYFGYSEEGNAAIDGMIAKYQKANPNVKIKRTSYAFPDLPAKLNQTIATNTMPDIIAMDAGAIPSYAEQGALVDITEHTQGWPVWDEFYPEVAESATLNGKTYGVPFRSNSIILWTNQDILKQAGVKAPKSWDELRATAKQLTTDDHSGICFPATKDETGMFPLLSFLWQGGSDLDKLGDPGSVQALDLINALVNEDKSAPKSVLQWSWDDIAAQFNNGKCAMMINGPWVYSAVDSSAKFKWDVATLPAGPGGEASPLGGEAWVIGKSSKHPDEVWKLIEWLSDNDNSFEPVMSGLQSFIVRKDQEKLPGANWSRIVPTVSEQVKVARSRAKYGSKYNQISAAAQNMEQSVLTGQKSAQDAADEAKAAIDPLLPQG